MGSQRLAETLATCNQEIAHLNYYRQQFLIGELINSAVEEAKRVVYSLFSRPIGKRLLSRRYFNQNYIGTEEHSSKALKDSPSEFANYFNSYHAFVISKLHKSLKSDDIWGNIILLPEAILNYRVVLLIRDPRDRSKRKSAAKKVGHTT